MSKFFLNLLKLVVVTIILAALALVVYVLFFDPKPATHEINQEIQLSD